MTSEAAQPRLSVVMPVFGNSDTLVRDVVALEAALDRCERSHEVILVIDGDPAALEVAHVLQSGRISVLANDHRLGKGHAVAKGMASARGELIGFMDAGGDIDPSAWGALLELQRERNADAVIGSKWHAGSQVAYPLLRRVYSVSYHALVRALFHLDVGDTQVGIKVFRAQLVRDVVPRLQVRRFAFDVELLALARVAGYRTILEAPVHIRRVHRSTVNVREVTRMIWDTLRVAWRMRALRVRRTEHPIAEPSRFELTGAPDERYA